MLIFDYVKYKNFLSSGNVYTEIKLNEHKNTLILGENGAGKSTLLDAVCFGLFGKSFRGINKPKLCNRLNEKDCLVEIGFHISTTNYKIIRGVSPGVFEIYCNDKMVDQDSKIKDYQSHLEQNILKLNFKSFTQVVILGSASFIPFMKLSAAERRFIIEDLLDIQIFSSMNVILKTKVGELKDETFLVENKIDNANDKLVFIEKHLKSLKIDQKKRIEECQSNIKDKLHEKKQIEKEISIKEKEISALLKDTKEKKLVQDKLKKFSVLETKIVSNKETVANDIEFFENNNSCKTCKQDIQEDFKKSMVKKRRDDLKELEIGLERLNNSIKESQIHLDKILGIIKRVEDIQVEIKLCNTNISHIDQTISKLQKEVIKLTDNSDTKDQSSDLEKLTLELKDLEARKGNLVEDRHYYDIVAMMLKDSGIKTKIIKQYLPIINKLINKYLTSMGFFVNFTLDENFKEVIKSRGRDDFQYESFSEGERLRIDLSLLFTWRDIARMKNSANTNLLILDEIFDSSLDSAGTDEFLKLLQEQSNGVNIFVISHKGDQLLDKFENVIKFKKVKNFSIMEKG